MKPNTVSIEDSNYLIFTLSTINNREEKYKFLFNWFVNNFDYAGYGKYSYAFEHSTLVKTANQNLQANNEIKNQIAQFSKLPFKIRIATLQSAAKEASATNAELFNTELKIIKKKEYYEKLDADAQQKRNEYIAQSAAKYCGVCSDFANEFKKICNQANLPCLYVSSVIHNGVSLVGHAFNAVITDDVKFIDISAAIHAKESETLKPFDPVNAAFITNNPHNFFLKTKSELYYSDGCKQRTIKPASLQELAKFQENYAFNKSK